MKNYVPCPPDCPNRCANPNCHSTCATYLNWKKEYAAEKAEIKQYKEKNGIGYGKIWFTKKSQKNMAKKRGQI